MVLAVLRPSQDRTCAAGFGELMTNSLTVHSLLTRRERDEHGENDVAVEGDIDNDSAA